MAQLAEQLICNQQVIGSSPIIGFCIFLKNSFKKNAYNIVYMDGFPSGQRGQTVNLLQIASVVRIHLHPFAFLNRSVHESIYILITLYRGVEQSGSSSGS